MALVLGRGTGAACRTGFLNAVDADADTLTMWASSTTIGLPSAGDQLRQFASHRRPWAFDKAPLEARRSVEKPQRHVGIVPT
jgi:hypothetical protein